MRITILGGLFVVFVFGAARAAGAGSVYDLSYRPVVGLRVAYEESIDTTMKGDGANGNRSATESEKFHRQLVVSEEVVTEVRGGEAVGRRITFGPNSWWASKRNEQPATKTRLIYAGKTVNFRVTPEGKIEQDFGVQPKGELMRLLRNQILGRTSLFAGKPVAAGERWRADDALRPMLDLQSGDTVSAIVTLKGVREQEGRQVADIGMSAGVLATKSELHVEMELEGAFVIDVQTGVAVKGDLTGKCRMAGLAVHGTVKVTGEGSLEMHHSGRILPAGDRAVAGVANGG